MNMNKLLKDLRLHPTDSSQFLLTNYLKDFGFICKKYDDVFLEIFRATVKPSIGSFI